MSRGRRLLAALLPLLAWSACTPVRDAAVVEEDPLLPGGYEVVVDAARRDPGRFQVADEEDALRITTGPGGVAWRPGDVVEGGDFLAEATFTLFNAPPGYQEAFGVFVGGSGLGGPTPRYTYLLVRPTGDFLIKRRSGDATEVLVDWTVHSAVQRVAADGDEPVNIVGIMVTHDEASFLVNGSVVHRMPAAAVQPYGHAGLRINHRLDLRVAGWYLGAPPLQTGT